MGACKEALHGAFHRCTQDVRQHPAQSTSGVILSIAGFADGKYRVKCRSAYNQAVFSDAVGAASGGSLSIPLPAFSLDLAITIRPIMPGDATGNRVVDFADAVQALKMAAGLTRPTSVQFAGADVLNSGQVDVQNAESLERLLSSPVDNGRQRCLPFETAKQEIFGRCARLILSLWQSHLVRSVLWAP